MFIVDGHNLIGAMPKIKLSDPQAKNKLLILLNSYQKIIGKKIIVVFDGRGYGGFEINREGGIEVRYPSGDDNADTVIKNLMMNQSHVREMILITSDNEIVSLATRKHIAVQKSKDFAHEMEDAIFRVSDQKTENYLSPVEIEDWLKYFSKK